MKYSILLILGIGLLLSGCITDINHKETALGINSEPESVQLTTDTKTLQSRITYVNQSLADALTFNQPITFSANISEADALFPEHNWFLVAEVDAPVINGLQLSATNVLFRDHKAYVSYNRQGDIHAGGIDVFDLRNQAYPRLLNQALFDVADVNAIALSNGSNPQTLWLALSHRNKGAVVRAMNLTDGVINGSYQDVKLADYTSSGIPASANSIVPAGEYLYVTAGKSNGGLYTIDANTFTMLDTNEFSDAKAVAVNGGGNSSYLAALAGGADASLKVKQVDAVDWDVTHALGGLLHQNVENPDKGKAVLHFAESWPQTVFMTLGSRGLQGYDILSGETVISSPAAMLNKGNTNGVSSDADYIYMANGADGLSVSLLPEAPGELESVFSWDLSENGASANYVTSDGEWIFIAKGGGGLKILRKGQIGEHESISDFDEDGVPVALEPERMTVCSNLLPAIYDVILPEEQDATVRHPEYFKHEMREIELVKSTDVAVTFINEGAGYKNTLGYYYYHKDNPPQTVDDLNKAVIFPNASSSGYGGKLLKGHTMKLLGEFEEGTIIGFYLIADGWDGNRITDGLYTQYTIPEFNISGRQQSLIFYEQSCGNLVMAFEDIALPGGDKDYNDSIFMISTSDPEAIDYSWFMQQ